MCRIVVLLFAAVGLCGQDEALARLKREMGAARVAWQDQKRGASIESVHVALRDWVEGRLPPRVESSGGGVSRLESSLKTEIAAAGLTIRELTDRDEPHPSVAAPEFIGITVAINLMPELPDILFVTAGVRVPCGEDQAVYVYRFDANGPTRIIDDHPTDDWGFGNASLKVSEPDALGRRLLLIDRWSVQCASFWERTAYSVYRLSSSTRPPESLLAAQHGFWLGNSEDGHIFALQPDGLTIELLDNSVDGGVHNRTHLLRYSFADGVKRIEPFAFQPEDFAEEWLTRPWSEMRPTSAPATQPWHVKLHDEHVGGEYSNVVVCAAKPDRWSIGLKISYLGDKEFEEPIEAHFLVRDLGNYRFDMESVSGSEFVGCPGDGSPSEKHPWLSVEQLRALP